MCVTNDNQWRNILKLSLILWRYIYRHRFLWHLRIVIVGEKIVISCRMWFRHIGSSWVMWFWRGSTLWRFYFIIIYLAHIIFRPTCSLVQPMFRPIYSLAQPMFRPTSSLAQPMFRPTCSLTQTYLGNSAHVEAQLCLTQPMRSPFVAGPNPCWPSSYQGPQLGQHETSPL